MNVYVLCLSEFHHLPLSPASWYANANWVATVDLPTPPFPDKTSMMDLTPSKIVSFSVMLWALKSEIEIKQSFLVKIAMFPA